MTACGGIAYGGVLLGIQFFWLLCLAACLRAVSQLRRSRAAWSHGTARFCTSIDALRGHLFAANGLILGRAEFDDRPSLLFAALGLFSRKLRSDTACHRFLAACFGPRWFDRRLIRLGKFVHIGTFAPAGAGKSVSVLVPNLRSYSGSVVVTDPKPELYRLTAEHRRRKFGHAILLFDPCDANGLGRSVRFNPLDMISTRDRDFLDQCREIAELLVHREGTEHEPHWNNSAQFVICAAIVFVCVSSTDATMRNLNSVRELLSSRELYLKMIKKMQATEGYDGVVARLGQTLSWYQDRELNSILSTVTRNLEFLDSPAIAEHVSCTDFDTSLFRQGRATAYLTLPPERLSSLSGLQRLWIGSLLRIQTKGDVGEKHPVLWLLDEIGHLGKIRPLEEAVTLLRGKGIRLWFFFQSIEQVNKCYGDSAKIVLDNLGTKQFFGTTSYDTSDYISKCIGDTTISVRSLNDNRSSSKSHGGSGGDQGNSSSGSGITYSDTGRRLMMPSEVLTLPSETQLVFTQNLPVLACRLIRYYDAREFRRGGTGTRTGLGFSAFAASVLLLCLSGGFAAHVVQKAGPSLSLAASFKRSGITLPTIDFSRWRFRNEDEGPILSPQQVEQWLEQVEQQAEDRKKRKYQAAYEYLNNRLPVPDELHKQVTDAERVRTVNAARLEADRQKQRYYKLHPVEPDPEYNVRMAR